jgi:hypothetical protein
MRPVRVIAAVMFAAAIAVTGCAARSAAVHPAAPSPSTTAAPTSNPPEPALVPPTTTLPLGRVGRLDAVQAVGSRTVWAVGKGAILTTSNGGRTWVRVWRGAQELDQVDFVTASTG